jgi:flagellar hook protein FlgE
VDGSAFAVTIPNATYASNAALATAVQTAINADATLVAAGKSVTVTANASTGFITITANSAGPMLPGGFASSVTVAAGATVTNLLGAASVATSGTGTFNPTLASTYSNSTSLTVYDVKGTPHIASLYFQKVSPNIQKVYLTIDGASVPAAAGTAMATLNFSPAGQLLTAVPVVAVPAGTSSTQGANGKTVISDPTYTPLGANPIPLPFDFSNVTQFGGNFGVNALTQDGYSFGQLNGFSTSADGTILGRYSNGQSQAMGQIALANFTNPQGLQPMGNNGWVETATSGAPLVGKPGTSSLGVLQSSAVEDSNVDLTAELVNMITAQRIYQANAQTIKAQDQVLQTLVNLR